MPPSEGRVGLHQEQGVEEAKDGKEVPTGEVPPLAPVSFSAVTISVVAALTTREQGFGGYGLGRRAANLMVRARVEVMPFVRTEPIPYPHSS